MTRLFATTAAIATAATLGVLSWYAFAPRDGDRFAQCRTGRIAGAQGGEASLGGPFTLVDEAGRTVTDREILAKPSLIYFGYTYCPDVCPLDSARNAEAVDLLAQRGIEVQPVFITIDPARDTPQVLAAFTELVHPAMIGLTGSADQISAASKSFATYYKAQPAVDGEYLMDHTTFTYLTLPGPGFVDFFRRDAAPAAIADQVACFVDAA